MTYILPTFQYVPEYHHCTKPLLALINKYVLLILCFHKTNSLISHIIMYTKKSHVYRQVSNHRYNRSTEKGICRAEWTRSGCSSKYSDDMEYIPPIIARDSQYNNLYDICRIICRVDWLDSFLRTLNIRFHSDMTQITIMINLETLKVRRSSIQLLNINIMIYWD